MRHDLEIAIRIATLALALIVIGLLGRRLDHAERLLRETSARADECHAITRSHVIVPLEPARVLLVGGVQMECCRIVGDVCQVDLFLPASWSRDARDTSWCRPEMP
jgi:thiamine pyrophosphokinase